MRHLASNIQSVIYKIYVGIILMPKRNDFNGYIRSKQHNRVAQPFSHK